MLELCICELQLSLLCVCWTAVAHPPVSCFHTCFKHASVRALLARVSCRVSAIGMHMTAAGFWRWHPLL